MPVIIYNKTFTFKNADEEIMTLCVKHIFLFKNLAHCIAKNVFHCGSSKMNENGVCDFVKALKK